MGNASRQLVEEAYTEAVRTASRLSMLGALGFGVALAMVAVLSQGGGLFAPGYGLEGALLAGGAGGGIVFTLLALRASALARQCKRRLDEYPGGLG